MPRFQLVKVRLCVVNSVVVLQLQRGSCSVGLVGTSKRDPSLMQSPGVNSRNSFKPGDQAQCISAA